MKTELIRILLVDDDEDDFIMTRDLLHEVHGFKYELTWAGTYDEGIKAMGRKSHDVYILDYRLGKRTGLELMSDAACYGCNSPMILLTGQGDHDVDIEAMQAGAADYLVKGKIDAALLERSIRYAIERKRAESERERLIYELQEALAQVKTLSGLLPICASCKKIRDDKGYWNQIEGFIKDHSDAEFSHSLCPECVNTCYPDCVTEGK